MLFGEYYTKEEYKKINGAITFVVLFVFLIGSVIYYTPFICTKIYHVKWLWDIYTSILKVLKNPILIKLIILLFGVVSIMTHSSEQIITKEKKTLAGQLAILSASAYCCLMTLESFFHISGFFGIPLHILTFICLMIYGKNFLKKESEDLMTDRRNELGLEFDQHRELVEHDSSINIPYKYNYLGSERLSWINVVNPFRGTLVGGTPGSGKSFAIIEEYMRQCIKKGFTGVIYDFKFPTLTRKTWNYLNWYKDTESYVIEPAFYMVNFDDPEYSHRCNPISNKRITSIADADEATKVLMLAINKTWIEKEGDFFTDSANTFTSILLWYLKLVSDKYDYNLCSFPHLITLSTFESTELLFLIFQEYDDLKAKMRPFAEALASGALEQLAGQVSSAGIALSKIASPNLSYILSGNDFDFSLNDPSAPKILCIGNNDLRSLVYSPALGLILTTLIKTMNQQNKEKSMFFIDEFPTVYFKGIDQLIGTARSNRINTLLGFQTFAQIKANYGDKEADKIIKLCGTRLMGQLMDDDAKIISESIGRQKILTRDFTYSEQGVSEGHKVSMESIVPPEQISQFSQGTFCGVVADDFKYPEPNKIVCGRIQPMLGVKNEEEKLDIPKIRSFISEEEKQKKTQEYFSENERLIHQFINALKEYSLGEWASIIETYNEKELLDEYLIKTFVFHRKELQDFTKFIRFEEAFKNKINGQRMYMEKKLKKTNAEIKDFFSSTYSQEEWEDILTQWIAEGYRKKYIDDYTINYQSNLQNDCYLLIIQELRDLKIFERAEIKKRKQYISFLEKMVSSTSFNHTCSQGTVKEYETFILEMKELNQREEQQMRDALRNR